MYIIDTAAAMARALDQPLDPDLRRLLKLRRDQMAGHEEAARYVVVEAGDTVASIEAAIGFPLVLDDQPAWEWAERHEGKIWEVVLVLSDDGPAEVLIADEHNSHTDLITLLHVHGVDAVDRQRTTAT